MTYTVFIFLSIVFRSLCSACPPLLHVSFTSVPFRYLFPSPRLFRYVLAPGCSAIECYVCDSSSQIGCAEFLTDTSLLEPQSCDNVYDAKYCVKMTQVFEGG